LVTSYAAIREFLRNRILAMTKRTLFCLTIFVIETLSLCSVRVGGQPRSFSPPATREIAITIDDLPLNGSRLEMSRLQAMTDKLLSGIRKHQLPVVGFVNESLLYIPGETDARIALLKQWSDSGVELGNHTFSHLGLKDTPLDQYEDDFIRGETATRIVMKQRGLKPRYFRHPFLQMGPTREIENSFENFIAARGYRIAPITIDIMDWMFRLAYVNARTQGDSALMKRVSEEYLKFADIKVEFCERITNELFGHQIKHILLLHANELNADNFDALVKVFASRGYKFISLEQALTDPVYRFPEQYKATSDWLNHWSFSKGKTFEAPMPSEFIQKIYADSLKPPS
jgi:peptidoglycan/xylan/chitin deacetylase (PgdA/CDA1 family)